MQFGLDIWLQSKETSCIVAMETSESRAGEQMILHGFQCKRALDGEKRIHQGSPGKKKH
jgi:hypothetical protein